MTEEEVRAAEAVALFQRLSRSKAIINGFFATVELQAVEMLVHSKPGGRAVQYQLEQAGRSVRDPLTVLGPYVLLLADWADSQRKEGGRALRSALAELLPSNDGSTTQTTV